MPESSEVARLLVGIQYALDAIEEGNVRLAEAILLAYGHGALTFRALGERTGLARNSIYRYFSSRDDLIAALCERDMPRWLEELEAAMAAADGRDARVAAFVSTQLRLVAEGRENAEIAAAMFITVSAVKYHVSNLLRKFGCRDRTQLVSRLGRPLLVRS